MTQRYVCVHGHFYQPPRENPWLESIERQESAHPYHDWNQRVTAECYAPNAASRLFDEHGRIVEIVNNYARISFNFGATLLSWMEEHTRFTYGAIVEADRESRERFGGHGSAMAQAYGHLIMPLSGPRDKRTQVYWGIRDFQARFGRDPEGMWLPETAVDLDTLEALAEHGIAFTVLAPRQAAAVRPLAEPASGGETAAPEPAGVGAGLGGGPEPAGASGATGEGAAREEGAAQEGAGHEEAWTGPGEGHEPWHDVSNETVDPSRPYLVRLPSGRSITVFFYDGPISRAVAFEELSRNGQRLAERLLGVFTEETEDPRLVHIAIDGETFGHHHVHGELALSYAMRKLEEADGIEVTNYGQFLERHPPTWEARIFESSSWSCIHGVERWRSDCGCTTGGQPRWNQAWRAPLRAALDGLRAFVDPRYEEEAGHLVRDPWAARDDYIEVILDRDPASIDAFVGRHAERELSGEERVRLLQLMELQRHAMYMFTSCGWFFAEISGIETMQVLVYAARVVQLCEALFGASPEPEFLSALEAARSNIPEKGDARRIYEEWIRPQRLDLERVAAHYAIYTLFGHLAERHDEGERGGDRQNGRNDEAGFGEEVVHCYRVRPEHEDTATSGRSRMLAGWGTVRSTITGESTKLSYAAVYAGNHNVVAGVGAFEAAENERAAHEALEQTFLRGELADMVRTLDRDYGMPSGSIRSLFRDEQKEVLDRMVDSSVREAEALLQDLYERSTPLMRFAAELGVPHPAVFQTAAESVLRKDLQKALAGTPPDLDRAEVLLEEARERGVQLEPVELRHPVARTLQALADMAAEDPDDYERLAAFRRGVDLLSDPELNGILWGAQNTFYRMLRSEHGKRAERAASGDEDAERWVRLFEAIAEPLRVAVP